MNEHNIQQPGWISHHELHSAKEVRHRGVYHFIWITFQMQPSVLLESQIVVTSGGDKGWEKLIKLYSYDLSLSLMLQYESHNIYAEINTLIYSLVTPLITHKDRVWQETSSSGCQVESNWRCESLPEQFAIPCYHNWGSETLPISSLRSISAVVGWTMPSTLIEPIWLMSLWVRDSWVRKKKMGNMGRIQSLWKLLYFTWQLLITSITHTDHQYEGCG